MEIGNWTATRDLNEIYRQIRSLGLETNLAELEAFGFTVVEGALSAEQVDYFRDRIVTLLEERMGRKLDLEAETDYSGIEFSSFLLYKDRRFKEAVTNQKMLALITYLLGKHRILSSFGCHPKGPGGTEMLLHADTGNNMPDPLSAYSHTANCNYTLTDYTMDAGCLAMVPGSHRHARQPTHWEMRLEGADRYAHAILIEAPAGSAIIWHGNTWHGSFVRKKPGLRLNLSTYFCREYIQPQETFRHTVPEGFLEEGDTLMASLLGADLVHGWKEEGPLKLLERNREAVAEGYNSWQEARSWQS